jgi:hypothetical protein
MSLKLLVGNLSHEMTEEQMDGQKAISMLNGRNIDGRPLAVMKPSRNKEGDLAAAAAAVTDNTRVQAVVGGHHRIRSLDFRVIN